jgi:signal transduction histidine kinase
VRVDAGGVGRFDQDVESAVYFSCLEALQNIAKYAAASSASIELRRADSRLRFTVTDDGLGFDPAAASGSGLQGVTDRLAAIGGTFLVDSAHGRGTTVTGDVPVGAQIDRTHAGDAEPATQNEHASV